MIRSFIIALLFSVTACNSIGISGTAKPTDNIGVSLGSVLTPGGVQNSGSVSVKLF